YAFRYRKVRFRSYKGFIEERNVITLILDTFCFFFFLQLTRFIKRFLKEFPIELVPINWLSRRRLSELNVGIYVPIYIMLYIHARKCLHGVKLAKQYNVAFLLS